MMILSVSLLIDLKVTKNDKQKYMIAHTYECMSKDTKIWVRFHGKTFFINEFVIQFRIRLDVSFCRKSILLEIENFEKLS